MEHPNEAALPPDFAARVAESLGRLLGYLRTWQNPDGLLGGTIATWWSSTLETAVPHPMNQFPVILGFLDLHRGGVGGGDWLAEARRVGTGLLGMIQSDGMLRNAWGDIPGRHTGTVIFAAPALALAELHADTGDPRYLAGARTLLDTIERRWSIRGMNAEGVANQGLKWCEAMLAYARGARAPSYERHALWLGRRILDQQIRSGPMAGGICQSRGDDRLISVYQGKCLTPLVRLYEASRDTAFLGAACCLARFLLTQRSPQGLFLNYHEPQGLLYRAIRGLLVRFDYRIFRRRVPTYRAWRSVIRQWRTTRYPSFVARAGDSIRGLWLLAQVEPEFRPPALDLAGALLRHQWPHGGVRNTVGYAGCADREDWQDVCCPTRWNGYAFLLLASLARGFGGPPVGEVAFPAEGLERRVGPEGRALFREAADVVEYDENGRTVARIAKPSGEPTFLAAGWDGELTSDRTWRNLGLV